MSIYLHILNYALAAMAVFVGLLSVFWWNSEKSILIKGLFVSVEIFIIAVILIITSAAHKSNKDWHARWLDARSLAELLRSYRPLLLIATAYSAPNRAALQSEDGWVAWYVQATIREITLPSATYNTARIRLAIDSAIEDEISNQIIYNEEISNKYSQMDRMIHRSGEILFKATFFVGIGYVLFVGAYLLAAASEAAFILGYVDQYKDFLKSIVTILGAGFPAFGAALLGIRANGEFKVISGQSLITLKDLSAIKTKLQKMRSHSKIDRDAASRAILTVLRAQLSDLRDWSNIYRSRELELPG